MTRRYGEGGVPVHGVNPVKRIDFTEVRVGLSTLHRQLRRQRQLE